jgi:hypothetical protein
VANGGYRLAGSKNGFYGIHGPQDLPQGVSVGIHHAAQWCFLAGKDQQNQRGMPMHEIVPGEKASPLDAIGNIAYLLRQSFFLL